MARRLTLTAVAAAVLFVLQGLVAPMLFGGPGEAGWISHGTIWNEWPWWIAVLAWGAALVLIARIPAASRGRRIGLALSIPTGCYLLALGVGYGLDVMIRHGAGEAAPLLAGVSVILLVVLTGLPLLAAALGGGVEAALTRRPRDPEPSPRPD
ncbi:hypothetical protein J4H92_03970 [Leucobacter weissii]|uniref:Uncharacterized protein n=1 Tax=Leucobacter weissii TaxID=1983706 RepID=A0A939S597_9MICO|nr:hypothetical protein [Leucobacter weissii]MBO1901104.1 hypothetical protein [Leucobacter weissii]